MPNCSSKPSAVVAVGARHHPGVADEDVQLVVVPKEPVREGPHAGEVGEVELPELELRIGDLGPNLLQRVGSLGEIPHGHRHGRAVGGQRSGRLQPEAGRCSRDHHASSGEVDAGEDVVSCGVESESDHPPMLARPSRGRPRSLGLGPGR